MEQSNESLGRLEPVPLRTFWASESDQFTPWLAEPENLKLLGETIGLELELEAQEKDVGPFRADILCRDTGTGSWVLIENQLERTDHTHLGQLLTYAAGLKAVTIVWIAERFTDEHRASLDWLSDITDEKFNFFGLEVELWRIGESRMAPKFNIVSEPNEWSREVTAGASRVSSGELTEIKALQLRFWTAFREFVGAQESSINPTKPYPEAWMSMGIGRTGFNLSAVASAWDSSTGSYDGQELRAEVALYGDEAKAHFARLEATKEEIERNLKFPLTWHNPSKAKSCKVYVRKSVDLKDEDDWPSQHTWLLNHLEALKLEFAARIKDL